jgi:hypothetical protein
MLPKWRFAIRALRVDPASHPAVADAAFARYAARLAAQPGRDEHHVPPNRFGIKILVPATVSCFLLCAVSNCHSLGKKALEACRGTQGHAIHGLVELPPHISLAIYEGLILNSFELLLNMSLEIKVRSTLYKPDSQF